MNNAEKKLRDELDELLVTQVDALKAETFLGSTDEELRQFDTRGARIHALSEKIRNPQSR